MAAQKRLKNEFTEDEKNHNRMAQIFDQALVVVLVCLSFRLWLPISIHLTETGPVAAVDQI